MLMSNDSSALNRTSFEGGKYNIDVDIEISDTKLSEKGNYQRIFGLFILIHLWTIVLTFIPVFADVGPTNLYPKHDGWYVGDDIIRIIEPIGGLVIHMCILWESGIFDLPRTTDVKICVIMWALGAAVYEQGAGFHSASCMFKNALETFPLSAHDDYYNDLFYYMKTFWEHIVSHYLYAAGYATMACCYAYAYRDHVTPTGGLEKKTIGLMTTAVLLYAILITGVAADFPSGCIVGLIYTLVYGLGVLGCYMIWLYRNRDRRVFEFGRRPVLQYFVLSYLFGLFGIIAWIGFVGGLKTKSQAGV